MQRAPGQHDDLTRVSRARSRAGRRGRSVATRHRRRATSRCSARMEPAVRSPRIEPAISTDRTRKVRFGPKNSQDSRVPKRPWRPQPYCGERNFWMRRRKAKNRPERPQESSETERANRHRRKCPQKRPVLARPRNPRFGRTEWWGWKGPNCQPPTQSSNRSLTSESGTEFFDAETDG
jgi:hypothetical protein